MKTILTKLSAIFGLLVFPFIAQAHSGHGVLSGLYHIVDHLLLILPGIVLIALVMFQLKRTKDKP